MKKKRNSKKILFFLLSLLVVFLLHSFFARVSPTIIENKGISFGVEINLFLNLGLFLAYFIFAVFSDNKGIWLLLLGGGSNLIDRVSFGYVRDYWPLLLGVYNNLNDFLITIGVFIFIFEIWKKK